MKYSTPESRGIPTAALKKYIDHLEAKGLSTHSLIVARGNDIVLEKYWAPFNRDFLHRMYSVTKSFVALALGFLEEDGLISLEDPISKYFPKECELVSDSRIRDQKLRHMLMMRTALPKNGKNWFKVRSSDRVLDYFTNNDGATYPSGTRFSYDSTGSFVLGALVERVTGKGCIEYLYEKMLGKLGVEGAYALRCPGGHEWMDSALLMRPIDLLKCARFVLNGGVWEGERLLNAEFIAKATSALVSTAAYGESNIDDFGYGYLIWRTVNDSFFFNGMGCQLAVCNPEKDLIFVYNGDNQGNPIAKSHIIDGFFDIVYPEIVDDPLPEYSGEKIKEHSLFALKGDMTSPLYDKINGKKIVFEPNKMNIEEMTFSFDSDVGKLEYVNKTGQKTIEFGILKNVFSKFPEDGYSDLVGSVRAPGNKYDAAVSAAFIGAEELLIRVQIIDKYFGNLSILLSELDGNVTVRMQKSAEDFLDEYEGLAVGKIVSEA